MIPLVLVVPLFFFFQPAAPTFTIAGTLVDAVTEAPISNARVTLNGVAAPFITGADGVFRFTGVKEAKYRLTVERLGYSTQSYAQQALSSRLSTAIAAGPDQATINLVFRMIPGAVIAGYIRDPSGEPVVGMEVQAVRIFGTGKTRHTEGGASASTDDRGYYRVRSLAAGLYAIVVGGQPRREVAAVEPMAYPVTFYPGVTNPAGAGFIRIKPGEETPANVTLRAVPAVRIDGEVISAAAADSAGLYVGIQAPSLFGTTMLAGGSVYVVGQKFTFLNVPAGSYHLLLARGAGDTEAAQALGVADVDVRTNPTSVSITEGPPQRISIHLTVRGKPRVPNARLVANLSALDMAGAAVAQIGPDGTGVFAGYLQAGRYGLIATQSRSLTVTSVTVNGALQTGLVVGVPDTGSVRIDAIADASTVDVSGRVLRDGLPKAGVLVLLAQRDTWDKIGIYRSDQSDSDGTFSWPDLPPGEYLAFALEHGLPEDYDDAESLRALLPVAQPLRLTDAPSQNIELKLAPLPATK